MRGKRTHQHQWPTGLTRSLEEQAGNRTLFQRGPTRKPVCQPNSEPTTLLWHLAGVLTPSSRPQRKGFSKHAQGMQMMRRLWRSQCSGTQTPKGEQWRHSVET